MKINQKIFLFCLFTLIGIASWAQETCPNNEIWYTTSNGQGVGLSFEGGFGASVVSNTYSDGKWILRFDGDVTSIGSYVFYRTSTLTSIIIPNSVTSIGYYAFEGCSRLTSITIGDSVTSIGGSAFYGCPITSLIYAEGTKNIFPVGLTSVESVVIPNSAKSIEEKAFYNCSKLTSITIPNSVTDIGDYAFNGCNYEV